MKILFIFAIIILMMLTSCNTENNISGEAVKETGDNCQFGMVDDPSPGQCGDYEDKNNDGFCDASQ